MQIGSASSMNLISKCSGKSQCTWTSYSIRQGLLIRDLVEDVCAYRVVKRQTNSHLLRHPERRPAIMLDEATSALDAESESKVRASLEPFDERTNQLGYCAFDLADGFDADRIWYWDQGEIIAQGTTFLNCLKSCALL